MTNRWVLLATIIMISCCCCSKSPDEQRKDYLDSAEKYLKQQKFSEASIQYKNALKLAPDDENTLMKLGDLQLKLNNVGEAYQSYAKALKVNPKNIKTREYVSSIQLIAKQYDSAIKEAKEILRQDPDNYKAKEILLQSYFYLRDINTSLIYVEDLLKSPKISEVLYVNALQVYRAAGQKEKAWDLVTRAMRDYPRSQTIRFFASDIAVSRKDIPLARKYAEEAYAISNKDVGVGLSLAQFYERHAMEDKLNGLLTELEKEHAKDPRVWLFNARRYEQKGDLEKALGYARQAYALEKNQDTTLKLAQLHGVRGEKDKAKDLMREAVKNDSKNLRFRLVYADLLLQDGQEQSTREALKVLDPFIAEKRTDVPEVASVVAKTYFILHETQKAKTVLENALAKYPDNLELHSLLAKICFDMMQYDQVLKEIQSVKSTGNRLSPELLYLGAVSAINLKQYGQAGSHVAELKKLGPRAYPTIYAEALLLSAQDKRINALQTVKKGLELWPESHGLLNMYASLGQEVMGAAKTIPVIEASCKRKEDSHCHALLSGLHDKAGNTTEAISHMKRAIALDPDKQEYYLALAALYTSHGLNDQALAEIRQLLAKNPDDMRSAAMLALVYQKMGKQAEEKALYEKILSENPTHLLSANNLGWMLAKSGDPADLDKAMIIVQKAKDKYPDNPQLADTLGYIYYKKGMHDNAISQFSLALKAMPEDPEVNYHMGLALHAQGKKADAKTYLTKALAAKHNFAEQAEAERLMRTLQTQ